MIHVEVSWISEAGTEKLPRSLPDNDERMETITSLEGLPSLCINSSARGILLTVGTKACAAQREAYTVNG